MSECCEARARLVQLLDVVSTDVEAKRVAACRAFPPPGSIEALRLAQRYRDGIVRCIEELGHVSG